MNEQSKKEISKFLSLILRHQPQTIGLTLDENGWADVKELLDRSAMKGRRITRKELEEVVDSSDKKRFAFDEAHRRIRANQGHSVEVDLALPVCEPPELLYHGTVGGAMDAICAEGLKKMQRQHVHLSKDWDTAFKVGGRRGKPVILIIRSAEMHRDGLVFYLSDNGVWLTDHVPPGYIDFS